MPRSKSQLTTRGNSENEIKKLNAGWRKSGNAVDDKYFYMSVENSLGFVFC
jgi:hypothetical protein